MLKLRQPLLCRRSLGYLVKVMLHFSFKSALLVNVFLPLPICRGLERRETPVEQRVSRKPRHFMMRLPLGLLETGAGFMKK